MRHRVKKSSVLPQGNAVSIATVPVEKAVRLVTLEDPNAGTESARGAFARLRPPEGLTQPQIDAWRAEVAKVAKAVKVLPALRPADVPAASLRVDVAEKVGTIRQEALALAEETKNPEVVALVTEILDEVGA